MYILREKQLIYFSRSSHFKGFPLKFDSMELVSTGDKNVKVTKESFKIIKAGKVELFGITAIFLQKQNHSEGFPGKFDLVASLSISGLGYVKFVV